MKKIKLKIIAVCQHQKWVRAKRVQYHQQLRYWNQRYLQKAKDDQRPNKLAQT